MIAADRFIETSDNREAWLTARRRAVTATEVAKASTPAGFIEAKAARRNPLTVIPNDYMRFGSENEDWIARDLKTRFGVMPNHWLIAAADNPLHMATPDCLSLDHTTIAEIKTGGREPSAPPLAHVRQMQWQFRTTDAEEGIYAFMLRREVNGVFVPAWLEPKTWPVTRDERMIADLIDVAERLLEDERTVAA